MSTAETIEFTVPTTLGCLSKEQLEEFAVDTKRPELEKIADPHELARRTRFAKVSGTQAWNNVELSPTDTSGLFTGKSKCSERQLINLDLLHELSLNGGFGEIAGLGEKSQQLFKDYIAERVAFLAGVERPAGQQG